MPITVITTSSSMSVNPRLGLVAAGFDRRSCRGGDRRLGRGLSALAAPRGRPVISK